MLKINDSFTSTGQKFFHHKEALEGLRTNKQKPVVSHIMLTDVCQHTCAMCSVQTRTGTSLSMDVVSGYLAQLVPLGLKSVILSGGGNPILFKNGSDDFNSAVDYIHSLGLEIGLITNGLPMVKYPCGRTSWKTVKPETLDKLKWVRISMSGFDHKENEVFVPDIDRSKTTLGFSYVYHDIFEVPEEPNHGKVSTQYDLDKFGWEAKSVRMADDRFETLTQQIGDMVRKHNPTYCRLLPDCLVPELISKRCDSLREMANRIDPSRVFVQFKPPEAPSACYLGYLHPVLNSDGFVFSCDSCVLNKSAGHKFAEPWRLCRWDEVSTLYSQPVRSLIKDPKTLCPGCVFTNSNKLLTEIVNGMEIPEAQPVQHPNFV